MKSALIVVDVQQSFMHRPYWDAGEFLPFLERLQPLVDRASAAQIPVLQVFHVENGDPHNPFCMDSGFVKTVPELRIEPTEIFHKSVHSAMFASNAAGQSVDYWLRRHGVERIIVTGIRTEQCCETTTRHASDLGYDVVYALDATLTFPIASGSGRQFSVADLRERTELVLAGRFASVMSAEAVPL
jgi:nicotinamidase-related amidase